MADSDEMRELLIDTTIALGEHKGSWEAVHLHEIAAMQGITLDEVRRHFPDKDAIVHAWFDRADRAMLREAEKPSFPTLSPRERLQQLLMAWLAALAPHRRLARQMIFGQLEPNPLRLWAPGLLRINRTVRWMHEAARHEATYLRRVFEESGLAMLYLSAFCYWMNDTSPASSDTHRFLQRNLALAERLERWMLLPGRRSRGVYRAPWPANVPPSAAPIVADEPTL